MKVFIRATGNISPQKTFGHPAFLNEAVSYSGNRLRCIEPDYKAIIDPKWTRRMSRIIRMGVAAAMECLQEGGVSMPGAIITGTAYGCLEDTGVFLTRMTENHEELLTPTSFIQSTHNTVGAQIALMLACHNYNNTYVHRGFSFESALLDAMLLVQEGETEQVLAGSVDEITDISHSLLSRFDIYKPKLELSLNLFQAQSKGTIAGEGACFFLLSGEQAPPDYAAIEGVHTFYKPPHPEAIQQQVEMFLSARECRADDIDLIITGRNGDARHDNIFDQLNQTIFRDNVQVNYKHLCGEYPTSSSFALWMAANILKTGSIPPALHSGLAMEKAIKKVLIYNHSHNIHHSLLMLSAC